MNGISETDSGAGDVDARRRTGGMKPLLRSEDDCLGLHRIKQQVILHESAHDFFRELSDAGRVTELRGASSDNRRRINDAEHGAR